MPKERPLIASVIYNRLHDDVRLDIDATVRFVTGNWTKPLKVSELQNPSPYNTRVHSGLPPGPIGSPGLASIKAAAHPAKTDYLFYVAAVCGNGDAPVRGDRRRVPAVRGRLRPRPSQARRQVADELLTALAGVLGFPVGHSRSPAMMNAAFGELGLDWRYVRLPVAPDRFDEIVRALPASGYLGANVTIPHKVAAHDLADELTEAAAAIGAVNTLAFADGRILGDNTDAGGLVDALGVDLSGIERARARRGRHRARGGLGAARGGRGRGRLEPHTGARGRAGRRARRSRTRGPPSRPACWSTSPPSGCTERTSPRSSG